jgi:hypothetical protein
MPQDKLNVTAMVTIGAGGLMMYAAVTGKSVLSTLYAITSGVNPATVPGAYPVTGTSSAPAAGLTPSNSSAGPPVISGGGTRAANIALAQQMAAARGWTGQEWNDLFALWQRESAGTWSPTVTNPTSGAYGIPQSLPASKMASAGADWQTNPATQIKWGLDYIAGRYGTPSVAWQHEQSNNWY